MSGLVKGWTEQIIHPGIDNDETFGRILFHIKNTGDKRTTLTDKRTTKLKIKLLTGMKAKMRGKSIEIRCEVRNRMTFWRLVINTKASTDIEVRQVDGVKVDL